MATVETAKTTLDLSIGRNNEGIDLRQIFTDMKAKLAPGDDRFYLREVFGNEAYMSLTIPSGLKADVFAYAHKHKCAAQLSVEAGYWPVDSRFSELVRPGPRGGPR